LDEYAVLLAQIAGRGCHDRALTYDDFARLSQGLADVVFADEVGRTIRRCRRWC